MSETAQNQENNIQSSSAWIHPTDVLAIHKLRLKKKALQARINRSTLSTSSSEDSRINLSFNETNKGFKRRNPFVKNDENKKAKTDISSELNETSDNTLFKLFHPDTSTSSSKNSSHLTSFSKVLSKLRNDSFISTDKAIPEAKWIPIDWSLKHKLRLMSPKPFAWNRTLKTSEEASGVTGFVRCLDAQSRTALDTSPNAQFHQCCLYWQHPILPWLEMFPRNQIKSSKNNLNFSVGPVRESLHLAWSDSFRSLFQLVRARQCPYFYVCAHSFTACFRAAGICGFSEMHVLLTPTNKGFRNLLTQEDITFTMPLKPNKRQSLDGTSDQINTTSNSTNSINEQEKENKKKCENNDEDDEEEEDDDEDLPTDAWLQKVGLNEEEIERLNKTTRTKQYLAEKESENTEESLILVEGVEAHGFYNFLINCKSVIANIGSMAGVPPTLLAPVAFHGASLQSLKVRETKIRENNSEYFSFELQGPILPHTIHSLHCLVPKDCNITATFATITSTNTFSKVKLENTKKNQNKETGSVIFGEENLSDCGLKKEILKHFCSAESEIIQNYECLKFNNDKGLFTWM